MQQGAQGHAERRCCRCPTASSPCGSTRTPGCATTRELLSRVLLCRVPSAQPRMKASAPGSRGSRHATSASSCSDAARRPAGKLLMRERDLPRRGTRRHPRAAVPLRASTLATTARGSRRRQRGSSSSTASPTGRWPSARRRGSCCCPIGAGLPSNDEIEAALVEHHALFGGDAQRKSLRRAAARARSLDAAPRRVVAAAGRRRRRRLGEPPTATCGSNSSPTTPRPSRSLLAGARGRLSVARARGRRRADGDPRC